MARIALLTQVLPFPPDSGPKVKTYNVLKYLAQKHEVTLISFVRGDQSKDVEALRRYCKAIHVVQISRKRHLDAIAMIRSLFSRKPWMMLRDDRVEMRGLIDRLCGETQFDLAHADQLNMAQYAARVTSARKVLDAHNALWLLYKRLAETMPKGLRRTLLERDWRLLKRYEGMVCRDFDAVLTVSEEDKSALIEAMMVDSRTMHEPIFTVIPIACDGDEVVPVMRKPSADHLVQIGTMYWPPNIDGVKWFVDEILPIIREKRPDVVFDCIGSRPPHELVELSKRDPKINVTGYVEDAQPYLENCGVFIVPLRAGGGMRVKILNAMAQALPIVTTTLGCEGIDVQSGEHLWVADSAQQFANAVLTLLERRDLADQMGKKARARFDSLYDYRAALRPIDDVYSIADTASKNQ
jgi:glycosyltransferase involved in cell wall biosynthesis